MTKKQTLTSIESAAKLYGMEKDPLFNTVLDRYKVQLHTIDKLSEQMESADLTVVKEYVKGRQNVVINPLISEYNKTVDSANKTVGLLIKCIKDFGAKHGTGGKKSKAEEDPLLALFQ